MIKVAVPIGMAAAVVVVTAACAGPDRSATPKASASATPTVSTAEAAASEKALVAYRGYLAAYTAAGATADSQNPQLRTFLADPLLGDVVYYLAQLKKGGLVRTGDYGTDPRVTEVNVGGQPKTVKITDCLDSSKVAVVRKDTGKPAVAASASPGQSQRVKSVAEAYLYDDGIWRIHQTTVVQGATC